MSVTSRLRAAAFARLPKHWQPIAAYHYYRARSLLDPELAVVCGALLPGMRAIDVGANEGVYTHAFAYAGAVVEAFEPQPACLDVLLAYARRRPNVVVHGLALGDRSGMATLHVPARDGRAVPGWASLAPVDDESARYHVDVRTLDSFAFKDVAVIKIDVEGHELAVLRGARETIARCRPLLLVEIEQRHLSDPIRDVLREVSGLGYSGSFLLPQRGERPLSEFDPAEHQRVGHADQPHALYVNNFIFSPNASVFAVEKART